MAVSSETAWALGVAALAAFAWWQRSVVRAAQRDQKIRLYIFSRSLFDKLQQKHPHLDLKDCHLVARALRAFFLAHLKSGRRFVGMPSRVVDDLWHEFILDTREYTRFCNAAFGRYFHHSPATPMAAASDMGIGLKRTWRHACAEENIDWRKPTRLPLLFAIDDKLKIANGYHYGLTAIRENRPQDSSGSCGGGTGSGSYQCVSSCAGGGLTCESGDSGGSGDGGGSCGGGCGGGGD